jgi:predicted RecA/RadA family phage recombinase
MATNHVAGPLTVWDHVAAGDISSGDVVEIGAVTGVALVDIATGATGAVAVCGSFELPKVGVGAIAQGAAVEWTGTAVQALAAGTKIGVCRDAAADGATVINVMLER